MCLQKVRQTKHGLCKNIPLYTKPPQNTWTNYTRLGYYGLDWLLTHLKMDEFRVKSYNNFNNI